MKAIGRWATIKAVNERAPGRYKTTGAQGNAPGNASEMGHSLEKLA